MAASEDVPGEKWDRCIADSAIKTGVSLFICIVIHHSIIMRTIYGVSSG